MITYLEGIRDGFPDKMRQLVEYLANIGIQTALVSTVGNPMADYVQFSKKVKVADKNEYEVIMFGMDVGVLTGEGKNAPQISPILMMEYGSGWNGVPKQGAGIASSPEKIIVGRGSFPSPTAEINANNPKGWWYRDENGVAHNSKGEVPQFPMQHAYDMMQIEVDKAIKRIFRL